MKALLFSILLLGFMSGSAQVGPANNKGREYGNPRMPLMVSHLAGANKERLKRVNKFTRHSFFGKILCFRKVCRIQSGHSASLHAISFKKFKKKVARNARRGEYKNLQVDSTHKQKPVVRKPAPAKVDTTGVQPPVPPTVKADTLIILGAELLFETNKSTLLREHFGALSPIIDYLMAHPGNSVKISGHTDSSGREAHNLVLSKQRADVVAEYLVNNGIAIDRVDTSGLGSSKPIADNSTEEGKRKNRRVELLIHRE